MNTRLQRIEIKKVSIAKFRKILDEIRQPKYH
jgi:hypothetical protein